ncbi:uncharacterized protein EAE98_010349 [Botrytis deweyae]|uniref:BTB domain-containing protein n=2 Tax=Botrytis TaxID=33196 RepID=A0A4Z1JLF6_9HELO|nr:uncharacterized protein EAE98_010349 [Botrytis deweyae]KAF7917244.1 hypothetical protein EAE98_010349 [Botrytis deweyae]KAF7923962.1 hypothetical protein EAE99_006623 [Botrytis elliptica]TGO70103.1 hypothetical protein BELL_0740g00030 [Botrytis elliptica]
MSLPSRNSPTIKALIEKQKEKERNTIQVRVGKHKNLYTLEKDILYRHAPFLKGACEHYSRGLDHSAINFPQTNDVVFKLFKTWLYKLDLGDADEEIAQWKARKVKTGEEAQKVDEGPLIDLDTSKGKGNTKKIRDSQKNEILEMIGGDLNATSNVALTNFCYPHMANLLDLYLFADMAKLPLLKNQCIAKYYRFTKATGYIMTPWLSYMWKYTTKGMLIRKFLLDLLTWEMPPLLFETNAKDFPEELRLELLVNMGYVIQVARHGTTALEKSNPLNEMSNYFEEVEKSDA